MRRRSNVAGFHHRLLGDRRRRSAAHCTSAGTPVPSRFATASSVSDMAERGAPLMIGARNQRDRRLAMIGLVSIVGDELVATGAPELTLR